MREPTAYFVRLPRRLEDLRKPHFVSDEKPYTVNKTVALAAIDYENFVTDLRADRRFIEENAGLCRIGGSGVWHCILAKQRNRTDGVLVMSGGEDFPLWAAYIGQT